MKMEAVPSLEMPNFYRQMSIYRFLKKELCSMELLTYRLYKFVINKAVITLFSY
jgi:hypothetical protein